jgi:DNA-repair protein complementing XP-A cells
MNLPDSLHLRHLLIVFKEENRLKAKARRDQYEAAQLQSNNPVHAVKRTPSGFIASNSDCSPPNETLKRPHSAISKADVPQTNRDARNANAVGPSLKPDRRSDIQAARKFTQYVDWDLSAITDTKGGFLTAEDDPRNKALNAAVGPEGAKRPAGMTERQWEKEQLVRSLRSRKAGPFEPGLSVLSREKDIAKCRECGTVEIDWVFETEFKCRVCSGCKEKFPEKYSLLTKTEVKADYLLTDGKSLHFYLCRI